MKILQITNKSAVIHIQFEEGQQGKKNMMVKINRFLTKDLKSRKAKLQKLAAEISDMPEIKPKWDNMQLEIFNIDYYISKINDIVRIEDYNRLYSVEVASYEVY